MEITYWHRLVQLYHEDELDLAEIAKVWIINTAIGVIEDNPDMLKVGINVLDNSQINEALVYSVIAHLPDDQLVSYPEIGRMLSLHPQTVGRAVKSLIAEGVLSKEDYGASGSGYTILEQPTYPKWIQHFAGAIVELHYDDELREAVAKECENIHFSRGMEVLKEELRKKFYRRKKSKD